MTDDMVRWHCTTDHTTEPCGECPACREDAARYGGIGPLREALRAWRTAQAIAAASPFVDYIALSDPLHEKLSAALERMIREGKP